MTRKAKWEDKQMEEKSGPGEERYGEEEKRMGKECKRKQKRNSEFRVSIWWRSNRRVSTSGVQYS